MSTRLPFGHGADTSPAPARDAEQHGKKEQGLASNVAVPLGSELMFSVSPFHFPRRPLLVD